MGAELGLDVTAAESATAPVFDGSALAEGTLVVAVGAFSPEMRELDAETLARADAVFGDVPEEVAETGDMLEAGVEAGSIALLSDVLEGRVGRDSPGDVSVVGSVGSAVFDQATAGFVLDRARDQGVVVDVDL